MSGLVELARQYVSLSYQLDDVRNQIKRAVLNGGGDAVVTTRPIQPARKAGGSKPSPPARIVAAAQAEAKIIELIREKPLRTSEIARATKSKTNTTIERLKRLRAKGQALSDGGEWRAAAPA